MTKRSLILIPLLVLVAAAPARADSLTDARRKRDADKVKRGQIAAKIDVLKASDRDLEKAQSDLENRVRAQENAVIAAQQASQAAQQNLKRAEDDLAATDKRVSDTRTLLADRAVTVYMNPIRDSLFEMMRARSFSEASRREALLSHVISNDRVVLDELRAVRQDQEAQRANVAQARQVARDRRTTALDGLKGLQTAKDEKERVRQTLQGRLSEFIAEADAVEREESSLSSLIREKEGSFTGPVSASGLIWPVRGPVTSGFGMRWGRLHAGIDISAGTGTAIHAAKSGTVIFVGWMGGYGNAVIVSHGGGFSTLYGHQSRLGSSQGQNVDQGQTIGYVGSTGHSTGPHLHFETRVNGTAQNPRGFLG